MVSTNGIFLEIQNVNIMIQYRTALFLDFRFEIAKLIVFPRVQPL